MAIAPALDGADLAHGLTAAQRDRLQGATGLAIFQGSLVRIRLRAFTGRVVFSDDGSTSGAIPVADSAFRAAATAGVETPGVRAWLSAEGCDCAQGYLFSRPVPWPELLDRAPDAVPALDSTVSELMAGGRR